jgi:signal transduction histidine kinase
MNQKKLLFIILLLISFLSEKEARSNIQSDTLRIKTMADDTAKVNLMITVAEELRDFNIEQGLSYAQKGLELSIKLNYKFGMGSAYKVLGINFYRMGIYDAALDNCLKAIGISKEIKATNLLCRSYNNIGLVYFARLEYVKAGNYMLKGLKIANELNDITEQSRILHNIALVEFEKGNINLALKYHLNSLNKAQIINNLMLTGYNFCSLSKCYIKLIKYDSAKVYLEEGIRIFKKMDNPNLIAMAYNQYADLFTHTKDYSKTLEYANMAYKIGESIGNKYMRMESSDLIAKAYLGLKDYENSLKYRTRYYEFSDTMKNESNIKSIAYIEAKFEYDKQLKDLNQKKEKEINHTAFVAKVAIIIALLLLLVSLVLSLFYRLKSKTNIILIEKNKVILELNHKLNNINITKDKFLSIIAHDLRSPFNVIMGFSNLLYEDVREKNLENIEAYSEAIQNSSQRTMDLLKNLLEWARLQTGGMGFNAEFVEIVGVINNAAELLADVANQKSISILKELPANAPLIADKEMISMIIRNLISNAIKFTNQGGKIILSVEKKQNEIIIAVKDNGIGIAKSNIEKLFKIEESYSTKGTQNEQGTGLGLILCKEFVEKHGGKIWVESEVGIGSVFNFSIPSIGSNNKY